MCKIQTTASSAHSLGENLKPAAIAGVVIGSVAGMALVILGICFLARRRFHRELAVRQDPQNQSDGRSREKARDQSYGREPQNQTG